jgi:hypothetical protein
VDSWLQDLAPRDKPMNFVYDCGVPLVHRQLLDLIGDDVVYRDLHIGRVFGDRGNEIKDWVTARGRVELIVRGTVDAGYRTCEACGRTHYDATGRKYLFPQPPDNTDAFESDYHGPIVTQAICDRVRSKSWRRLPIDELPVVDPPSDGMGLLPSRSDAVDASNRPPLRVGLVPPATLR